MVACKIHEYQREGKKVDFRKLVEGLKGLVSRSAILNGLNTLSDWGIVRAEFGETEAGRAGRLYYISGEAEAMIKETYDKFWDRVMEEKK